MFDEEFEKIPDLPEPILRECLKSKTNLIVFVGAGLSCLCGYPLWDDLANDLLEKCKKVNKEITNSEIDIVKHTYDSISKITFASSILPSINDEISNLLKKKPNKNKNKILKCLNSFKSGIITTNADTMINEIKKLSCDWRVYNSLSAESAHSLKEYPSIVHLHGSIDQKETLIFTLDEYAKHYKYKGGFAGILENIFSSEENKIILFIGYSLKEFQLLQYVLNFDNRTERHIYKLDGYLLCEKTKIDVDRKYYSKLGITLVPYSREIKGYDKLVDVLDDWRKKIENTINILHNPDIKIENSFKGKPTKLSIQYVSDVLPIVSSKSFFASNLINSPFFKEWVQSLSKTSLFDPAKNFKPCVAVGDNKYSSSYWIGLDIIESYTKHYGFDDFIKKLTKRVLRNSAKLLRQDKNIDDAYKRRNSSFSIMHYLIDILTSNETYLDDLQTAKEIIISAMKSPFSNANSLSYTFYEKRKVLVKANPKIIFWMYKTLLEHSKESSEYTDYYIHDQMELIIKNNPKDYFNLGIKILKSERCSLYFMAAFYNYGTNSSIDTRKSVSSYYVKTSSRYLEKPFLEDQIIDLIDSQDDYLMRIGLCLININYDICKDIFVAKLPFFVSKETFFSDLKCLLSNNRDNIIFDKDLIENIVKCINSINYGANDRENELLKKSLFASLGTFKCGEAEYNYFLSFSEIKEVSHFNQKVYSEPIDFESITNNIFHEIESVEISNLPEFIKNKYRSLSPFYRHQLFNALDKYLASKEYDKYCKIIREITDGYLDHYINEINCLNTIKISYKERIKAIHSLTDEEYERNIDSVLDITKKIFENKDLPQEDRIGIIKETRYQLIDIKTTNEIVTNRNVNLNVTHGNSFFLYFDMLLNAYEEDKTLKALIVEEYLFFKNKFKDNPVFAFDIGICYDVLLNIDKVLFETDFDLWFNARNEHQFLSLAFVKDITVILDRIKNNHAFTDFLKKASSGDECGNNVCLRILLCFVSFGNYKKLVHRIISIDNIRSIESFLQSFMLYLNDKADKTVLNRFNEVVDETIRLLNKKEVLSVECDRLMLLTCKLIDKSMNYDRKLWELLIAVSRHKHDYYFDEIHDVFIRYSAYEKTYLNDILYGFVESFEKYEMTYFVKRLIPTLDELRKKEGYESICDDIKRRIINKEISMKSFFKY